MSGKCSTFFGAASGGTTIPPTTAPTCYDIGACSFSESSKLAVTKYHYAQQADCSFVVTTTVEYWSFASRDASTFRWSDGASQWAQYNGATNQWQYSSDDPFDTSGAGPFCFFLLINYDSVQSCSGATFYVDVNGTQRTLISWVVIKNSCSVNVIA